MKIKPIAFSFVVSLVIAFIFLFLTFWIFYKYSWSVEAAKDALSTTGSYFGAIATLGAACVAAYLFNDWRYQHNKTVEKEMAWVVIHNFDSADFHLSQFQDDFQNFKYRCQFLDEMPDGEFQGLDSKLNGILDSLKGASLKFSSFSESTRKYSFIVNKSYFDDISEDVQQISSIIFKTQNYNAHYPDSMNTIGNNIEIFKEHLDNIEEKCINKILLELKALT